jgi:hypothetical protein
MKTKFSTGVDVLIALLMVVVLVVVSKVPMNFGYIDGVIVLERSTFVLTLKGSMETAQKEKLAQVELVQQKLKVIEDKYKDVDEKDIPKEDKDSMDAIKAEMEQMVNAFNEELRQLDLQQGKLLEEKLQTIAAEVKAEKKLLGVFTKSVVHNGGIDVTDYVISLLDKK